MCVRVLFFLNSERRTSRRYSMRFTRGKNSNFRSSHLFISPLHFLLSIKVAGGDVLPPFLQLVDGIVENPVVHHVRQPSLTNTLRRLGRLGRGPSGHAT